MTRQYTRMTNAAGGPPTRSVCLLGFVQVPFWEAQPVDGTNSERAALRRDIGSILDGRTGPPDSFRVRRDPGAIQWCASNRAQAPKSCRRLVTRSGYYGRGGITRVSQIELLALPQCFPE